MRVLFTVALAVVLLAVALPAIEHVAVDRSETATRDAVDGLVDAARALASSNDALANEADAARRVVSLDLPDGGFASVPFVSLTVGPPNSTAQPAAIAGERPGGGPDVAASRITWRVEGGTRHVRQVDDLRLRPRTGERLELRRASDVRLVVTLVERDGRRVLTVRRWTQDATERERREYPDIQGVGRPANIQIR